MCVDNRRDRIGGIVKPVYKLKPERHQQRNAEEQVWHDGGVMNA